MKYLLLNRTNLLRQAISFAVAIRTNIWVTTRETRPMPGSSLSIPPQDIFRLIEEIERGREVFRQFIQNKDHLTLSYEAITGPARRNTFLEIQSYLDIPLQDIDGDTIRQTQTQQVENIDEIKAAFAHTKWAKWLDLEYCYES